jgi:energy-coupling factor transport system permease protein
MLFEFFKVLKPYRIPEPRNSGYTYTTETRYFFFRHIRYKTKRRKLRTAYGNEQTPLAKLDPRMLVIWVLIYSVINWLTHNLTILISLTILAAVLAYLSKVSPLLIILLIIGVISQFTYLIFAAMFLGNSFMALIAVIPVTLKVSSVSLVSMAVFTSMDPEKFSDALQSFGVPDKFSFGVSYVYRMLPILIEEYQNIIHSFRLRGKQPEKPGFLYARYIYYYVKMSVMAFYPMMLIIQLNVHVQQWRPLKLEVLAIPLKVSKQKN